jgi:hypothetical protein
MGMMHHGKHHVTRELGTPNKKPRIAVGLGKTGLVPAYVLDEDSQPAQDEDGFRGMTEDNVNHIMNPDDFNEYPIPDSFIGELIKRIRKAKK